MAALPSKARRPPPPGRSKPSDFIAAHPVFRLEEFIDAQPGVNPKTAQATLQYHLRAGNLTRVRRGVYARDTEVDPCLVASRLAPDAVLAYDGALEFHGLHTVEGSISYLTNLRPPLHRFADILYQPVAPAKPLKRLPDWGGEILDAQRRGLSLRVTSPERTLVDCLDRLDLTQGGRDLWDCFRRATLSPGRMIDYAARLKSRLLAARLGYFLENLGAQHDLLRKLEKLAPRGPSYFDYRDRQSKDGYFRRWNLVVPFSLWLYVRDSERPPADLLGRILQESNSPRS